MSTVSTTNNVPLVSVLMTAYNREKYIIESINSVLASSYENFELIIVDDRSSDKTFNIANSYAQKDSRVKVHINEKNLGDYANRNKAASYAKGKYLKYVDSDDMIYPWGLEVLVSMMEKFPNAGWGICDLDPDETRMFPFEMSPEEAYLHHYSGAGMFHRGPLASIIKKNVFDAVGGFSGKQHLGDFELWHLLATKFSVVAMPKGIIWYRRHDDQQMTHNIQDVKVPFKYKIAALHFFQNNRSIPLSSKEKSKIMKRYKFYLAKTIMGQIQKGKLKTAWELLNMLSSKKFDFKQIDIQNVSEKKINL